MSQSRLCQLSAALAQQSLSTDAWLHAGRHADRSQWLPAEVANSAAFRHLLPQELQNMVGNSIIRTAQNSKL